ncbi:hypothetical protein [Novosphingobium sp. SG707]|uniref:hypothetical protein n=1 Tax=Novosphingobium sp. SG707 TaxID=2586996 RepID=UPI00144529D0|nr:hypothetical protein [Novosphingobium sp. SG707]NKI99594.1 hypothetical protein [Novosphingobium sp. SG707]
MDDLHSNIALALAIAASTYSADSTAVTIDRLGHESLEIALNIGVGGITFSGTNKIEFVLTHSDDDNTYTAVTDTDMLGVSGITNGIIKALVAAHAAANVYRFGYKGGKRYLRLVADFSGTHGTGTAIAACAILGCPMIAPVANQA